MKSPPILDESIKNSYNEHLNIEGINKQYAFDEAAKLLNIKDKKPKKGGYIINKQRNSSHVCQQERNF